MLEAEHLSKTFGGVRAVHDVSLRVCRGETLGLIGPNGAGKTTTFELLAGFTRSDRGSVFFEGQDITALGPEARARLGLIRSFQDAALFPTLTVAECVQLSLERERPTRLAPALLGLHGQDTRKQRRADEVVAWMGLGRYRNSTIQELSTGTRRITEIACLVALGPRLLLLDEPSSGVAQRETEALGHLLEQLKADLGLTLVVIEHDIPLIMGLSDRIVCMADGQVIAEGPPHEVRADPAVVEAYLGGDPAAIERSDSGRPSRPGAARSPLGSRTVTDVDGPDEELLVPGVGVARRTSLLETFGSVEALRQAGPDQLGAVPGIGPELAARIHRTLGQQVRNGRGM